MKYPKILGVWIMDMWSKCRDKCFIAYGLIWWKNKSIGAITVWSITKSLFFKDLKTSFKWKQLHKRFLLCFLIWLLGLYIFLPWKTSVYRSYPNSCSLLILFLSLLYVGHWQIASFPNSTGINWNILLCGKCCAA